MRLQTLRSLAVGTTLRRSHLDLELLRDITRRIPKHWDNDLHALYSTFRSRLAKSHPIQNTSRCPRSSSHFLRSYSDLRFLVQREREQEYRNEIRPERYPIFWNGDKTLKLSNLLALFQSNAVPGNFVTPLAIDFNFSTGLPNNAGIRFHMATVPAQIGAGSAKYDLRKFLLEATLTYSSLGEAKVPLDDLWPELAKAHELLFQNFLRQFTSSALQEFAR